MRFASLGGSNAGNYAAAGKSVADSAAKMHAVQRKAGPDYTGLSRVAMQTASNEKVAGMQAEAKLTNVAQAQYAKNTQNAIKVEVFNKGEEIKNSQRKAGGLAAIGKMAGAGFLAATDNTKGRERPKSDLQGLLESHKSDMAGLKARQQSERDELGPFKPIKPSSSTGSGSGEVTGGSSTVTPSNGTGIRSQAFNYLTKDKGLSKNKALGIIANVDRESGWNPSVRSGDDGGPGGLFQWKGSRQTSTVAGLVDSGDWKGQLDYALSEPGEAFSQTYQNTAYESPQQAADAWMTHWERPADTTAGSKKHTNFLGGYSF
tara:strand:+ start:1365 stop:2315 length:951 start_codon:yes stop_codon:yes gene_type:complete